MGPRRLASLRSDRCYPCTCPTRSRPLYLALSQDLLLRGHVALFAYLRGGCTKSFQFIRRFEGFGGRPSSPGENYTFECSAAGAYCTRARSSQQQNLPPGCLPQLQADGATSPPRSSNPLLDPSTASGQRVSGSVG